MESEVKEAKEKLSKKLKGGLWGETNDNLQEMYNHSSFK